jgi:hypothetical protein
VHDCGEKKCEELNFAVLITRTDPRKRVRKETDPDLLEWNGFVKGMRK